MRQIQGAVIIPLLLLTLGVGSNCLASEGDFEKAVSLFNAMEFQQAEPLFLTALFSRKLTKKQQVRARSFLAEIYVGLRKTDKAIEQYDALLLIAPDFTPSSDSSPAILSAFDKALTSFQRTNRVSEIKTDSQPGLSKNKQIGWGLVGTGGGLLVLGGVGYILADQEHQVYKTTDDSNAAKSARTMGQTYEILGMTSLGLGLVSAAVGVYFLVTEPKQKKVAAPDYKIQFDVFSTGQKHFGVLVYKW